MNDVQTRNARAYVYSRYINNINNITIEKITLMTDTVIILYYTVIISYYYRAFIIDVIYNITII